MKVPIKYARRKIQLICRILIPQNEPSMNSGKLILNMYLFKSAAADCETILKCADKNPGA